MSNSKTITIVGGGRLSKRSLARIVESGYVIGVDRGAYWLIANKIIPDIAIGDFDSVSARELEDIKKRIKRIEEHPKEKDFTDMELAVDHAITLRPREIVIYGSIGNRLDHTIGNIHLLERIHKVGIIRDVNNEVRIVSSRMFVKKEPYYRYISLLPIGETIEVSLAGFAYNASHAIIHRGQTLGISNEIRGDEAIIEVYQGKALVVRSKD